MPKNKRLANNTIIRAAQVLSQSDRKKVIAVIFLQLSFGVLDLIGVGIIGIIGALAITGIQSRDPGNRVSSALNFLQLDEFSLQWQVGILGICAALILIGKTIFTILFTRKILFFLSRKGADISGQLVSKLFSQSLLSVQVKSMNEMMYSVTTGVGIITVGILGTTVTLVSDVSLLVVMSIGLFVIEPGVALSLLILFSIIGLLLYKFMHKKARYLGIRQAQVGIESGEKILEVIRSYRETVVRNRRDYYSRIITKQRLDLANVSAEMSFMPNISKYVMEIAVVIGSLVICAVQFILQDAAHAIAVLSIFLAASTRIAPAILRLQQGAISVKSSLGSAAPTLELIESLRDVIRLPATSDEVIYSHDGFVAEIKLENLSFTYPGRDESVLSKISLRIEPGQVVALVGPSGAGKTTLVDVILGVLPPSFGSVSIAKLPPLEAIAKFPGAVAYVPQDVMISNGSIKDNVAMGFPHSSVDDELVVEALRIAQLYEFVSNLENGFDSQVGDRGTKISGGQRQRLGIARAMFTKPQLLVLDEATSSLDGETEANISDSINAMKGNVTVLMIAHRLSTVRNADLVVYLENGSVIATGSFESVRSEVPDFDRQAQLMGL
jgi:ABC-type multidrug transport system fused ATPase/permease subunit